MVWCHPLQFRKSAIWKAQLWSEQISMPVWKLEALRSKCFASVLLSLHCTIPTTHIVVSGVHVGGPWSCHWTGLSTNYKQWSIVAEEVLYSKHSPICNQGKSVSSGFPHYQCTLQCTTSSYIANTVGKYTMLCIVLDDCNSHQLQPALDHT